MAILERAARLTQAPEGSGPSGGTSEESQEESGNSVFSFSGELLFEDRLKCIKMK